MVEDVVKAYQNASMPLETIWLDIPYMSNYTDFTVNKTNFTDLPGFVQNTLKPKHQKMVVILDAALSSVDPNNVYL